MPTPESTDSRRVTSSRVSRRPLIEHSHKNSAQTNRGLVLGNTLIGTPAPENAVGDRIAFETGTSYGNRRRLGYWLIGWHGHSSMSSREQ